MMNAAIADPVDSILHAPLGPLRDGGVGFVGPDISIDLLLASGRAFGHLPWHAGTSTPFADGVLESGFPGWSRSILEQWHQGAFDGLHAVVFSRTDDASQRLYYYVRELQRRGQLRGPRPLMQDLALVPRDSSLDHSAAAVAALAQQLDIDDAALREGIARADALRLQLQLLQLQRSCAGVFHERLGRALLWSNPLPWLDSVRLPPPDDVRRVLLVGSTPPDERLHEAVERGGACVVAETHVHAICRLGMPLELAEAHPARHVALQLVKSATGPRAFIDRAQWVTRQARESRAAAVILWLTREDEALAWHVPAMQRALAAAKLPALVLPVAGWRADDGALERIATFCREGHP